MELSIIREIEVKQKQISISYMLSFLRHQLTIYLTDSNKVSIILIFLDGPTEVKPILTQNCK